LNGLHYSTETSLTAKMPTYICHGFRWPRPLIRIHIILRNLDDAAAEWLIAPKTAETMIHNFKSIYPEIMPSLPSLRFLEQYDPSDESVESKSQPYAYVCDVVQEVKLGIEFDEVRGKGVHNDVWTAMMDLRDKLAPGEKVSWFVVVCGDVERWSPPEGASANGTNGVNGMNGLHVANGHTNGYPPSRVSRSSWGREDSEASRPSTSRSIKKFFGGNVLRKSKSMKSISTAASLPSPPSEVPPLPQSPHAFHSGHQAVQPPLPPPKNGPNITHAYARLPPELRNPTPLQRPSRQMPGQMA